MKTKNIFKAVALAMLMPTMLLTTACSSEDDFTNNTAGESTASTKGYPFPVTVNVSRQGDERTRTTYDGENKKLSFSAGDKLFVEGSHYDADKFAGTLDYDAVSGKFSGTIYTEKEYTGTIGDLMASARAVLLPAGYESYKFYSIEGSGSDATVDFDFEKAFALTKAAAVEQFSVEQTFSYDSGFDLAPMTAIASFTISGLTANKEVAVSFDISLGTISGNVTTSATGVATFAVGVSSGQDLKDCTLTVDGNNIAMPTKTTEAGHIYNITRSAAPAATSLSELKTAINGGTDCSSYIGWEVNSAGAIAESGISGTKIGYVAYVSTSDVDAGVSGSRILVLANADAGTFLWGSYGTSRGLTADDLNGYSNTNTLQGNGSEAHPAAYAAWNYSAAIPSGGATPAHWFMPTKKQWENMRDVHSGSSNTAKRSAMNSAFGISGVVYWSSTEYNNIRAYRFSTNGGLQYYAKNGTSATNVRAVFAY